MKKLLIAAGFLFFGFCMLLLLKLPALGLDGPQFCGMCHVMEEQVSSFEHSAHRSVASCGDCHVPHSLVPGAMYKAYTGTKDLLGVLRNKGTLDIHSSALGKRVAQDNCLRCHGDLLREIGDTRENGGKFCFDCHRNTPHLE
jgi:cytochrome c nitrite reductase small subunit